MEFDYDSELYICIDCIKNTKLKKFLLNEQTEHGICSFCHIENEILLDIFDNKKFYNFLRALIRYYFWEDEYNRHFGGVVSISELFENENNFIFSDRVVDEMIYDSLEHGINDYNWYDDSIVELYYGKQDGYRDSFGERYIDRRDSSLSKLEVELLEKNYFLLEDDIKVILLSYEQYYENHILKNELFYRARIGFKEVINKPLEDVDYTDRESFYDYIPYKNDEIGSPPVKYTSQGRLNRLGVSFLYLATDINTTIAEVRPHPGHKVSLGTFQCKNDLKIVDFNMAFIRLSKNEETMEKFVYLNHIDQLLSRPITPDERHLYFITQFFADIFRKIGFDGISFTSSVGDGQNLLIFDPSNFQYIENESGVYEIKSLKYEHTLKR